MKRILVASAIVAAGIAAPVVDLTAQQPVFPSATAPSTEQSDSRPTPLRVTVLLARYQGDKRVSSMPHIFGVMAGGSDWGPRTRLRMGTDVPVIQTVFGAAADGKPSSTPQSSYTYRNVGTSIDCMARFDRSAGDVFRLSLTVSDSSLGVGTGAKKTETNPLVADLPAFRSFNSEFTALLRDGQTMQYTAATDPVTGEVTRIDVTVNVMK